MAPLLLFLCLFLLVLPVQPQEDEDNTILSYGTTISGQINNASPRAVYYFDGLRGEVVSINLQVTNGDLDPMMTVVNNRGETIASLDDSRGDRVPSLSALRIPQTERYFVIIGRFGYGLGTTSGSFDLNIERVGVSSASGTMLRYGDEIINSIGDMNPQLFYSFRARQGDIVNIRMRRVSGDLDAYLQVVDSEAFVIADNDDGEGSFDSEIKELVIDADGVYVIVASRYGQAAGTSAGNFVLILQEAENSGLANSPQTALTLNPGESIEGAISEDRSTQYYRFNAQANDLISVRMSRMTGALDSMVVIANADLQELVIDDDSGGGQNAQIGEYKIPLDGTYYIIATRFDREAGTTVGGYKLELVRLGSAFDNIPEEAQRIGYGSTVVGTINEATTQMIYAFYGEEGDVITVAMNRGEGDLDPVVSILNSDQRPIVSDDDSGNGQNARISRYEIPVTGTYYVRATRYSGGEPGNPNTIGTYTLTLAQRFD